MNPNTVIDRVIINVINEEVVDCNIPKLQIRNGTKQIYGLVQVILSFST